MKKLDKLPEDFFLVKSEHEKALRELSHSDTVTIPIHTAQIRTVDDTYIKTIVPPTLISFKLSAKRTINRSYLQYRIAYNHQAFPLAHVYRSSGTLCLGTIFVPSTLTSTDLLLPLETLFLHNDRHLPHGNPTLPCTPHKVSIIQDYLATLDLHMDLPSDSNAWLNNDTLWMIGHNLLSKFDKPTAFKHADFIFKTLFEAHNEILITD